VCHKVEIAHKIAQRSHHNCYGCPNILTASMTEFDDVYLSLKAYGNNELVNADMSCLNNI